MRASKRLPGVNRPRVRGVAMCSTVRQNAPVVIAGISTGDYEMDARVHLGNEVRTARLAAGLRSRAALAELAGVSTKAISNLEAPTKSPPTGFAVLTAVALVLPGWTEDTPAAILEGGKAPKPGATAEPSQSATSGPAALYAALEEAGWSAAEEERFQSWKRVLAEAGMELNVARYLQMRHDHEINKKNRQPTPGDGK